MKNKSVFFIFCFCAPLFFAPVPVHPRGVKSGIVDAGVERELVEFESQNSASAVVILNANTAHIEYVYNPEFVYQRKFRPGSLAKVWSAVVLMDNQNLFSFKPLITKHCGGKAFLSEQSLVQKDYAAYNIRKDPETGRPFFYCSLRNGHGETDLRHALVHSCNAYFLSAIRSNPLLFYRTLMNVWKLDETTGARLRRLYETPPALSDSLTENEALFSGIGEAGIFTSPLKVAQTYAAFFSASPLLKPFEGAGRPVQAGPLLIAKNTRRFIFSALEQVPKTGTLKELKVQNKRIRVLAAKTGTGTQDNRKYKTHGWNVIYFQYNRAFYVLVVFVFEGSASEQARKLSEIVLNRIR